MHHQDHRVKREKQQILMELFFTAQHLCALCGNTFAFSSKSQLDLDATLNRQNIPCC